MEEVVNNQQLDQPSIGEAEYAAGRRDRRRLVLGILALLAALLLLGLAITYLHLRQPKVLTSPPTSSKISEETQPTPSATVEREEGEEPPNLDKELDELEKDLETLDQIDSELNAPELDLNLDL